MRIINWVKSPHTSLIVNLAYALGNCVTGFLTHSWWFITVGVYYGLLAAARFSVLQIKRKADGNYDMELFAQKITGFLLVALSFCIVGVNILSAIKERGTDFHEIVMITIAAYTFTKITTSIIGMIKANHTASPVKKALRNLSLSEATVSIYTMQRSMLVSFPGMEAKTIQLFNILTGTAVWIVILLLGINLIGGKKIDMAKSKIVHVNKKMAKAVTEGYKKMERGIVDGYKTIENGVTKGYTKLEDKFVGAYLTKEGETVAEAKARLKKIR